MRIDNCISEAERYRALGKLAIAVGHFPGENLAANEKGAKQNAEGSRSGWKSGVPNPAFLATGATATEQI
jgi:hypothetical protein